jgi:uncharacterized protein
MTRNVPDKGLPMELALKEYQVREAVREAADSQERGKVLVGFSGGVDSSLLLWESVQAIGPGRVIAVTATSPTSVLEGEEQARQFAADLKVRHLIVPTEECADPAFLSNSPKRCYVCKRIRYTRIANLSESLGSQVVLDGTQADDDPADRPGMAALEELGIRSPLAQAGVTKQEVRVLLKAAGFPELADQQAEPCLATRIPYGDTITEEALETVRRGEQILKTCGLEFVRLRHHGTWARIVTDRAGMTAMLHDHNARRKISAELKELGFQYVTMDLDEYGARR